MRKMVLACFLAAMMVTALPVSAQWIPSVPTIGVYFDEDGTEMSGVFNGDEMFTAYVMAHWLTGVVGGGSYSLQMPDGLVVVATEYPEGVHIGEPTDGCGVEVGLSQPVGGYWGNAILLTTLTLYSPDLIECDQICVMPHCNYDMIVVADANALLWEAVGLCSCICIPVETEASTWGKVKCMYR